MQQAVEGSNIEESSALPDANRDNNLLDQDEEINKLIRMFSNGAFTTMQLLELNNQNSAKTSLRSATYPDVLPPPSTFIRRRKSSYAVPAGPSFVDEPTTCNDSIPNYLEHDEYWAVLTCLTSEREQLQPPT
jgi:hypothetical protein